MKNIIERKLPLNVTYHLIDKYYNSLENSIGICCENCGRLISNIAVVKSDKQYYIGFDCLETLLLNNKLLTGDIENYQLFKKQLPTMIKHTKELQSIITEHNKNNLNKVTSLEFDVNDWYKWNKYGKSSFLTFYYVYSNGTKYNSNFRLKNDFLIEDFIRTINNLIKF